MDGDRIYTDLAEDQVRFQRSFHFYDIHDILLSRVTLISEGTVFSESFRTFLSIAAHFKDGFLHKPEPCEEDYMLMRQETSGWDTSIKVAEHPSIHPSIFALFCQLTLHLSSR